MAKTPQKARILAAGDCLFKLYETQDVIKVLEQLIVRLQSGIYGVDWCHIENIKWNKSLYSGCNYSNKFGGRHIYVSWLCGGCHKKLYRDHHIIELSGGHHIITCFITPPTSFSQSRHSIDITWRHTLSPRYTQRQKSVTGIHWKCLLRLNKGCWHDKFVIRSVNDILRTQSRFVKCVGGSACGLNPHKFYKPTLGPKYNINRPYN